MFDARPKASEPNQCGKCGKQSTPTYHKSAFAHQVWEATHARLKYVSIYIIYSRIHARPFSIEAFQFASLGFAQLLVHLFISRRVLLLRG